MPYAVYVITHLATGRRYVGMTGDARRRWAAHRHTARWKPRTHIGRAIRKYGSEAFTFEVVCQFSTAMEAANHERMLIRVLRARDRRYGFNESDGGEGGDRREPPFPADSELARLVRAQRRDLRRDRRGLDALIADEVIEPVLRLRSL
jgi:predicted GIY-YIG superfamily endonuclease